MKSTLIPRHPAARVTLGLWLLAAMTAPLLSAENNLTLRLQSRSAAPAADAVTEKTESWDPARTALVICDMWDDHWCKSAAARVVEMAGPMNVMVKAARARGLLIVHAPSTCTGFYADTPQRKRAQEAPHRPTPVPIKDTPRWGTTWCWTDGAREGVLPIDDSDMGCDCAVKCTIREAWKRQIAAIDIAPVDAITDNGQEIWNLLTQRRIEQVVLCGVHLNMCVLGRPFGIRQMTYFGRKVALVRDMTDTMYNPDRPPGISHFAGTDRVIAHVERFWCPTLVSTEFTGKPPFRFRADTRPAAAP